MGSEMCIRDSSLIEVNSSDTVKSTNVIIVIVIAVVVIAIVALLLLIKKKSGKTGGVKK